MHKKTTRLIALAATSLMVVTSGFVASQATAAPKKTTITFFSFSAVPDHLTTLKAMVAKFESQNPTIKVNIQTAAYKDYFTKLQTRIAGNQAPDTFELNYENFVTYASAGSLLNLNGPSSKDKSFKKSIYYGKAYDVFSSKGKQFGLPESFSTTVLFYNKDLFDAAGVKTPNASWDWSDEEAASAALKSKLPTGTYADWQGTQFYEFYKTLGAAGGSFLTADKKGVLFNRQPGISALNWLTGKVAKGYMPTKAQMGSLDDGAMFKAGKLAMLHSGIWMFDAFKDAPFKWDISVEPGGVHPGNFFFANGVVASAKTKNADAAYKWAKFFTSDSASVKLRIGASWEIPATADKAPLAAYLAKNPPANRAAVFEALKNPVVPPVIRQQNELQDTIASWLEKAQNGTLTSAEALNGAAADVKAILARE